MVESFYGGALVFQQARGLLRWKYYGGLFTALPFYIALDFRGNVVDVFCFHPSGEQNSVCFDVSMKCVLVALVRTPRMC